MYLKNQDLNSFQFHLLIKIHIFVTMQLHIPTEESESIIITIDDQALNDPQFSIDSQTVTDNHIPTNDQTTAYDTQTQTINQDPTKDNYLCYTKPED